VPRPYLHLVIRSRLPLDLDGLVVPRELLALEPRLEPEIGRRNNDADVKLTDTVPISGRAEQAREEKLPPLVLLLLEGELLLRDTVEVALDLAELDGAG
jgi:hypothetical protein